jgi:lysophospholipase L1-like esterase
MKKLLIVVALALSSFTPKKNKVLFIGDSLTCYSGGWQHQFAKEMGYDYVNISKGGKRTDWMLKTLRQYLATHHDYDMVVIYGGVNDAFSYVPLSNVADNVQDMVDECVYYDMKAVVVLGYSPNKLLKKGPYSEEIMKRARDRYAAIQTKLNNQLVTCKILPVDTTVDRSDSDDGIHLRASGHRKFAKWVIKNLK